jgi:hypothetical protein
LDNYKFSPKRSFFTTIDSIEKERNMKFLLSAVAAVMAMPVVIMAQMGDDLPANDSSKLQVHVSGKKIRLGPKCIQ